MADLPPKRQAVGRRHGNGDLNGPGWGGPAKGAAVDRSEAVMATPGARSTPETQAKAITRERRREMMIAVYERIADDVDAPAMAQITAADKWLDRHEGKAIARTVSAIVGDAKKLDDAALIAIAFGQDADTED